MPYRIALDEPYVRVWFSGVLTARMLREVADELRDHESALGTVPDRLVDMSEVVATSPTLGIAMLAARVRGVQRFPNSFRSALVAPKTELAGIARIFRILNRNPQIEVEIFETVDAAERWLRSAGYTGPERRKGSAGE